VEGFVGITGKTVDEKTARALVEQSTIPVILAGGLSPENVRDALRSVKAAGADSCTQTNRLDGSGLPIRFEKDFHKVGDFVKAVRVVEALMREEREEKSARLGTLKEALADREKALPAHSVRPHQLLAIEALEEEIEALETEISKFHWAWKGEP
jgi:hypothetical protein